MATKPFISDRPGAPQTPGPRAGLRPAPLVAALAAVLLLLLGGGAFYLYQQHEDALRRVPPAVAVSGVAVGGLTVPEAADAVQQHFAALPDSQILLRYQDQVWTFTARDLGIALDATATAQEAHNTGRDVTTGTDVPLVLTRDRTVADAALQTVAADMAVAPTDADFTVTADGIKVVAAQAGRRLDADATWQAIVAATATFPFRDVAVQPASVAPRIADSDIAAALAAAHQLTDAPLTITATNSTGKDRSWTLTPTQLRSWLAVGTGTTGPTVAADLVADQVRTYLQGVEPELDRAAKDATMALPNYATAVDITPDVPGQQLNLAASVTAMQAAAHASGAARQAALVVDPVPAKVDVAALQPLKTQMDTAMRDGLVLVGDGVTYRVPGSQVALTLYLNAAPAGAAIPYQLTVNDTDLARLTSRVATALDEPAIDATYRLVSNNITLVKEPKNGRQVDQAATGAAVKQALLTGVPTATLTLKTVAPVFADTNAAATIKAPQRLQADSTSYAGSSPERNWNVTFGASKLDGWYIPPGGTFSLDDALGPLTLDAGFKMGWAILVQSGNATTIPAEAGGICQVATTLFHPVFWAGLPMVERHHHSYWIALYGQPPLGMQGLDATISPPDTDFKFKNTTGNWLLIRAHGDGSNLRVELWGTNPGWRVQVSQPVITNRVRTDTRPRTETSDKIAKGRSVVVEHAQDGFTSDIHRQVFDSTGKLIDDWHAQGTYLPSHNTTVVGTGPASAP